MISKTQTIMATNERNFALVVQFICLNDGYGILLTIKQDINTINGIKIGINFVKSKLNIVNAIEATAPAAAGAGKPEKSPISYFSCPSIYGFVSTLKRAKRIDEHNINKKPINQPVFAINDV